MNASTGMTEGIYTPDLQMILQVGNQFGEGLNAILDASIVLFKRFY
ncbi:MAG: hypothetical protein HKN87_16430 [Saprospiraceae bacterium]|nr:hypothetical protein [Saprospiraceae bacterium]